MILELSFCPSFRSDWLHVQSHMMCCFFGHHLLNRPVFQGTCFGLGSITLKSSFRIIIVWNLLVAQDIWASHCHPADSNCTLTIFSQTPHARSSVRPKLQITIFGRNKIVDFPGDQYSKSLNRKRGSFCGFHNMPSPHQGLLTFCSELAYWQSI